MKATVQYRAQFSALAVALGRADPAAWVEGAAPEETTTEG